MNKYKVVTDSPSPSEATRVVQADNYEWVSLPMAVGEASYKKASSLLLRFSRQGEMVAEFNADHVIGVELQEKKEPIPPKKYTA